MKSVAMNAISSQSRQIQRLGLAHGLSRVIGVRFVRATNATESSKSRRPVSPLWVFSSQETRHAAPQMSVSENDHVWFQRSRQGCKRLCLIAAY
jgi:hypothetical protein